METADVPSCTDDICAPDGMTMTFRVMPVTQRNGTACVSTEPDPRNEDVSIVSCTVPNPLEYAFHWIGSAVLYESGQGMHIVADDQGFAMDMDIVSNSASPTSYRAVKLSNVSAKIHEPEKMPVFSNVKRDTLYYVCRKDTRLPVVKWNKTHDETGATDVRIGAMIAPGGQNKRCTIEVTRRGELRCAWESYENECAAPPADRVYVHCKMRHGERVLCIDIIPSMLRDMPDDVMRHILSRTKTSVTKELKGDPIHGVFKGSRLLTKLSPGMEHRKLIYGRFLNATRLFLRDNDVKRDNHTVACTQYAPGSKQHALCFAPTPHIGLFIPLESHLVACGTNSAYLVRGLVPNLSVPMAPLSVHGNVPQFNLELVTIETNAVIGAKYIVCLASAKLPYLIQGQMHSGRADFQWTPVNYEWVKKDETRTVDVYTFRKETGPYIEFDMQRMNIRNIRPWTKFVMMWVDDQSPEKSVLHVQVIDGTDVFK